MKTTNKVYKIIIFLIVIIVGLLVGMFALNGNNNPNQDKPIEEVPYEENNNENNDENNGNANNNINGNEDVNNGSNANNNSNLEEDKTEDSEDLTETEENSNEENGDETSTEETDENEDANSYQPPKEDVVLEEDENNGESYLNDPNLSVQWGALEKVSAVAQSYYTSNFSKTRIITKEGYLYNVSSGEYINSNYFVSKGEVPATYLNYNIEVLLLKAEDLKGFENLSISSSESGLTVFSAMKHPTENLYMIKSDKSAGGVITAAQYSAILNSYYQNHGVVGKLYPGTSEYNRILSFISMNEGRYDDYFVRSITVDNKYAMVILSGSNNANDVKQFVLRKNGSIWEIVLTGLEYDPRVIITINKALPDFNIEMVPNFTINDHRAGLQNNKDEIYETLAAEGHIGMKEHVYYLCGTSNYAYIVLENQIKFVAIKENDTWSFTQVATSTDAEKIMLGKSRTAPTFIILDS